MGFNEALLTMADVVTIDFLRAFQLMVVILGLVIIYFATKGYMKTNSKSLLYLAVGFLFVTIGAVSAGLLFELLDYGLTTVGAIQSAMEVIGFIVIVYSIVRKRD